MFFLVGFVISFQKDYHDPLLEIVPLTLHLPNGRRISVITVYRRPNNENMMTFLHSMDHLLKRIDTNDTVVVGDFNADVLQNRANDLLQFMAERGFVQHVTQPTTNRGTCIDLVFANGDLELQVDVRTCYYSDHHKILLALPLHHTNIHISPCKINK